MSLYTLLAETNEHGRVSVGLRDGDWSFSVAYAPEDDPSNADAALVQLAKQIDHNLAHDRMTQIMLEPSRIPASLANLLTATQSLAVSEADEPAPWDDPMIMPTEDLAVLVGL